MFIRRNIGSGHSLLASMSRSRGLRSEEDSCSFTLATSLGCRMSNRLWPSSSVCGQHYLTVIRTTHNFVLPCVTNEMSLYPSSLSYKGLHLRELLTNPPKFCSKYQCKLLLNLRKILQSAHIINWLRYSYN